MKYFHPKTTIDKLFVVGLVLKSADGLLETVGGFILLFLSPSHINHLVRRFANLEVGQKSHNFIATHFLHWAGQITHGALLFAAVYLLLHGLAKLILVFEILRNHLWAYVGLIVLTGAFIIYQMYEVIYSHSIGLGLLTIFDAMVVWLTVVEYKKQVKLRDSEHQTG